MGRDKFPTEDEQFEAYKAVLEGMTKANLLLFVLLISVETKSFHILNLPQEMNPFLGYRAIRLCLDQQEIFRTQLTCLIACKFIR